MTDEERDEDRLPNWALGEPSFNSIPEKSSCWQEDKSKNRREIEDKKILKFDLMIKSKI